MELSLRSPTPDDWPLILALANLAVPFDPSGNHEWLEHRRDFEGRRSHYVAEDESGAVRGYGAIEQGDVEGAYRIFLVMAPDDLREVGDVVFDRLLADLEDFGASLVWAREYLEDRALRADLGRRGFAERRRFTVPGHREMVVLDRHLGG